MLRGNGAVRTFERLGRRWGLYNLWALVSGRGFAFAIIFCRGDNVERIRGIVE
jgi:hypothetical protein